MEMYAIPNAWHADLKSGASRGVERSTNANTPAAKCEHTVTFGGKIVALDRSLLSE